MRVEVELSEQDADFLIGAMASELGGVVLSRPLMVPICAQVALVEREGDARFFYVEVRASGPANDDLFALEAFIERARKAYGVLAPSTRVSLVIGSRVTSFFFFSVAQMERMFAARPVGAAKP